MGTTLARTCLRRVSDRDVLTWNLLIGASVQNGHSREAMELFNSMQSHSVLPDKVTLVSLLSACAKLSFLAHAKFMHAFISFTDWSADVVVGTALVSAYGKCDSIKDALRAFEAMPTKNVVTYNAIISAFVQLGDVAQACGFFDRMRADDIRPNRVTFLAVLDECSGKLELDDGRILHDSIIRHGLVRDLALATLLVSMYTKHNCFEDAWRVFDMMPEHDLVSWSSMIALLACQKLGREALKLFEQMKQECVMPDNVTYVSVIDACAVAANIYQGMRTHACILHKGSTLDIVQLTSLISMYGKCGDAYKAVNVFDAIAQPSVVSLNAMLAMYAHIGEGKGAWLVYNNMHQEDVLPNYVTFISILDACSRLASLKEGKRVHTVLKSSGLEGHVNVKTALVNMYGKCGSLEDAFEIFSRMEERNLVTWTAIISAFAQHGCGAKAMQLFGQMQQEQIKPDLVTFVSIFSACRHAGLIYEAYHWLNIMVQDYGLSAAEKHYECIIDLLGRMGRLDEAEQLIEEVPHVPTAMTWTALLGSCKEQVDVERGERAAISIMKMNPEECAPYVSLSNIYSAAGRNEDAASLMLRMKGQSERGILLAL